MNDQYGDPVPEDLVVLDWSYVENLPKRLIPGFLKVVDNVPWYEIGHVLCVSWAVIDKWQTAHKCIFDPTELSDVGETLPETGPIFLIQTVLHRYGPSDGFYHA